MKFKLAVLLLCVAGSLSPFAAAEVRLPAVFGDHMVLQQEATNAIWGFADPTPCHSSQACESGPRVPSASTVTRAVRSIAGMASGPAGWRPSAGLTSSSAAPTVSR